MFRGSTWLARLQLASVGIGCFGCAAFIVVSGRLGGMSTWAGASVMGVLLGTGIATSVAAVRLGSRGLVRVAAELSGLAAALVAADLLVRVLAPEPASAMQGRIWDAHKLGVPFDDRMKSAVVAQLRSQGVDALPGISREWPRLSFIRQQLPDGMFPLSHASNAEIVECNESGRYLVYHADEVGFNNPAGLVLGGHVDVAAVGASFTLGHCVPNGQSIVARLRQAYPKLADFGMAGGGTLSMLATFREYVEPLKPGVVLWIMHPWTADTRDEIGDPILSRYLDPEFSQHLLERREEVDQTWRNVAMTAQYDLEYRGQSAARAQEQERFGGILTLAGLRGHLHLEALLAKPAPPPDLAPFERAIGLAQRTTQSWGGRFIVIIMPLYAEVVAHELAEPLHHDRLAALLRGMNVEVIDTVPLFLDAPDPPGLYIMRRNNHPTPEGHAMLARFVLEQMRAQPNAASVAANRLRR